jgi:hypothetical protein
MKYRIRIAKGTEIITQSTGAGRIAKSSMFVTAERDPDSECMLFTMPLRGVCYVYEGYELVGCVPA